MESLNRFIEAQEYNYDMALSEVKNGRKVSHWMWYIFPQIRGLGRSSTAEYFGIRDLDEARDYLAHEVLGQRLMEITTALLELDINDSIQIFGEIDALKLKSSMTLFDMVSSDDLFSRVLDKFYDGKRDVNTLALCGNISKLEKVNKM